MSKSGWKVIYDYVRCRHLSEFGFDNVKVTHVWTQDPKISYNISKSCLVPNIVNDLTDLIGKVDGILILRDDYENHYEMSKIFLNENIPVFLDKPLTLKKQELEYFKKYISNGMLMSCSGFRFAREIDQLKISLSSVGKIKKIQGYVMNDWDKYAIHIIEPIITIFKSLPKSINSISEEKDSFIIKLENGQSFQIDSLGKAPKTFQIEIRGELLKTSVEIIDNFTAFRRTIWEFIEMVKSKKPPINADETINMMKVIIAAKISKSQQREVLVSEV